MYSSLLGIPPSTTLARRRLLLPGSLAPNLPPFLERKTDHFSINIFFVLLQSSSCQKPIILHNLKKLMFLGNKMTSNAAYCPKRPGNDDYLTVYSCVSHMVRIYHLDAFVGNLQKSIWLHESVSP